jgi:NtrC-family two-component system sensor histidine kinase KinB
MKIKVKLTLGTTLLFILIILMGSAGIYFIHDLAADSGEIIKDNYASLEHCRDMQKALNNLQSMNDLLRREKNASTISGIKTNIVDQQKKFEQALLKQEGNVTESGEKDVTENLKEAYNYYSMFYSSDMDEIELQKRFSNVHERITDVFNINMEAMNRKNTKAMQTGKKAIWYVSFMAVAAFIVSFTLLLNFPGYIADPLIEITRKIKEIANRNYNQTISYPGRKDELGELSLAFNTMSLRLQDYEKSNIADLRIEKNRIDSIVRNLNEGIILFDSGMNIKVFNPVAEELISLKASEVVEQYAPDVAVHNDLFRELIKDIGKEGKHLNSKPLRITLGNEENFFQKDVYRIHIEDPDTQKASIAGYILTLKNITEYKKLDLAKTNFIAVVSHELKTPISSMKLSLKLLEDKRIGELNEEQLNLVKTVKGEAERMSKITAELLDISQVETGNIRLTIDEVNPSDIVKISENVLKTHIDEKKIRLLNTIPENLKKVKADLEKTVWVMTNLLANAIRYTPEHGLITVSIASQKDYLEFSVQDTGAGIDPKNKERIFQRFVQVEGKKSKEGVGLGLAISKEFIQEQGGRIWVESELGIGSKFIFTLPLA